MKFDFGSMVKASRQRSIFFCFILCVAPVAHAQDISPKRISIAQASAQFSVKVPATKTIVSLQISRTAPTANEASEKNRRVSELVLGSLKKDSRVKNLQTTSIQLFPTTRYDNLKNEAVVTGYESSNSLQFESLLPDTGAVIDDAIKNGANTLNSVTFAAEDSVVAQARETAIAEATKKAKHEAEISLQALGLSAKGIQSIVIEQPSAPMAYQKLLGYDASLSRQSVPSTEVIGGDLSVTAMITVALTLP